VKDAINGLEKKLQGGGVGTDLDSEGLEKLKKNMIVRFDEIEGK